MSDAKKIGLLLVSLATMVVCFPVAALGGWHTGALAYDLMILWGLPGWLAVVAACGPAGMAVYLILRLSWMVIDDIDKATGGADPGVF